MERNLQKNGLINLVVMLVLGVAAFAVARYSQSLAGQVSVLFFGLGILVAAVSWFQIRLEQTERLERLELEEMAKGKGGSALFESQDAEVFPAQRSREQFERYFVPVFTVLLCIGEALGAWFMWRWLSGNIHPGVKEPMVAMPLFGVLFLVLFLLGKFSTTIARLENLRLLRPGASQLMLCAYISLAVAVAVVGGQVGFPRVDLYVAYGLTGLLGIVAAETVVSLILEVYRPRLKGKAPRPIYDSRLVGLLGQPEGLFTTAAQAIDYQFGFKVSDTWFFRFFERAILWLIPLQLAVLLFSTCLVIIEPGQQAVLEHFGRPADNLLGPGAHVKWPWPIDKVYRYRTEQIQSFNVGFTPEEKKEGPHAVLWTVAHTKEENFLVANRRADVLESTNSVSGKRTPPVSLLGVSIPVQYQITNLLAWAYQHDDAPALLEALATREVVRYLAGVDMEEIMSRGRLEASDTLVARIQAESDKRSLGARIISASLQDLHPPVKVAPDYEKVVGALQTKEARILAARADAIRTNALSEAHSTALLNAATAESAARQSGARAQAGLFTNQVPAFRAAPDVYVQRAYLQAFARATAKARKYLVLTTNTQDVISFDLQDKLREDMLNLTVPPPQK